MELSQPRPCGAQGAKPTHEFLSLYPPAQQDPIPTIAGGYLRTHDFLQPLDQVGKNVAEEGNKVDCIEKSFPPAPPTMVEHILPGGMGTHSISHVSYINQSQKVPEPDGIVALAAQSSSSNDNDDSSNCSSYTGSGFMFWKESDEKKGKTGKENIEGDGGMKIAAPWMTTLDWPSQSSSIPNDPSTTLSSLSSSHPSPAPKNQYFIDNVKSAKSVQEEEYKDEELVIKSEPSFHRKGAISVKVDTVNRDRKPNSPRSKHSATEQRRRSKINDRFSMLRGIIPHGDQKRDKASFLLEVIEYIQFLQEKVQKYEEGWSNEAPNMTPLEKELIVPNRSGDEQVMIESSIYSQGLSSALTQALRGSGVEANISVQIDLCKRSNLL